MLQKIIDFIKTDIWRIRLDDIPRTKSFFIKLLRVIILASRGFREDKCRLRASALTFYTLLSVIPIVAMAFGVAKGFGYEKIVEKQLIEKFPGHEEILMQFINYAHTLLERTKGGMMAGIGVGILIWIIIKLLSNIEHSFNDIWRIKKRRSIGRKLSDYLFIMLICPVLVLMSSSITVFIITQVKTITEKFTILGVFVPIIIPGLKLLPYFIICGVFAFIYIFIPNTKVKFRTGLLAGLLAGIAYQGAQWGYINFQIGVAQYNAIYGSFAALPLFLIWIQLSWLIVFFGAEISFAFQNIYVYEFEPDCLRISPFFKKLLSLQTAHLLVGNFFGGNESMTVVHISRTLKIPIRLVTVILGELVGAGIVSEINAGDDTELSYQPACDINLLTMQYVIDAIEKNGVDNIPVAQTVELKILSETLQTFKDTIEKSTANKLLKDI